MFERHNYWFCTVFFHGIRLKVKDISILGRPTQGVTLMRTTDGGKVVSIETLTPEIAEVEESE